MLVLWLATGLLAAQAEAPVERRSGGTVRDERKRKRREAEIERLEQERASVVADTVARFTRKKDLRPPPKAPASPPADLTLAEAFVPDAPTAPMAVAPIPEPERPLSPQAADRLGLKPVERTYDLELLLLLAA